MTFILFCYKIVAAILAIAGIVMLTYADGFHSHSVIGITLVVASASASALYKVTLLQQSWPFRYSSDAFQFTHGIRFCVIETIVINNCISSHSHGVMCPGSSLFSVIKMTSLIYLSWLICDVLSTPAVIWKGQINKGTGQKDQF